MSTGASSRTALSGCADRKRAHANSPCGGLRGIGVLGRDRLHRPQHVAARAASSGPRRDEQGAGQIHAPRLARSSAIALVAHHGAVQLLPRRAKLWPVIDSALGGAARDRRRRPSRPGRTAARAAPDRRRTRRAPDPAARPGRTRRSREPARGGRWRSGTERCEAACVALSTGWSAYREQELALER